MRPSSHKLILTFSVGILTSASVFAQSALPDTWVPDFRINQMTAKDGQIFMTGEFDWLGPAYQSGMAVFNTQLEPDATYPELNAIARLVVKDDEGGWYVVGYENITHVRADKTLEDLPITANNGGYGIDAIDKSGNILYIGGDFTSVNGVARNYIAAFDLTTNTLTDWDPGANGYVYSIKASGSTVYAGGSFSSIGGQTRSKIAALDSATGQATAWNANVIAGSGYVYSIAVGPGAVYFGGNFANVAGSNPSRRNFAAADTSTGALITSINPRPDGNITAMLLDGNVLYLSGNYSQIGAITQYSLAAMDVTTGLLTSFHTDLSDISYLNDIYAMAIDGEKLFLGGSFLVINGAEQSRLAVVNKVTGALEPVKAETKVAGEIYALAASDGVVFAVGSLRGISGVARVKGVAAIDSVNGQATAWYPSQVTGRIEALNAYNDRVYYLTNDGGTGLIGSVNTADGASIPGWEVTADNEITGWAFSGDTLFITGPFTFVNGISKENFAAVDLETGDVLPWTVGYTPSYADGEVISSIAVSKNVLYAAGNFNFVDNNIERNRLAAWDATTGALLPWAPAVDVGDYGNVRIGAVQDSKVYLLGDVCLRVDAVSGEPDGWKRDIENYGRYESMAISENSVFLAGSFSPGLINVDINTAEPTGWQPAIDDVYEREESVDAVVVSGAKLFAGGNFTYPVEDDSQSFLALFSIPEGPTAFIAETSITVCADMEASVSVEASGTGLTYQWQKLNDETGLFEDIADANTYSGTTSSVLTISSLSGLQDGDYRCVVSDMENSQQPSNVASVSFTAPCNDPPSIEPIALDTQVGGSITVDLTPLISTTNAELDVNSIAIVSFPASGAEAFVTDGMLTVDYSGISFTGTEVITIRACNTNGNCTTQQFSIEVAGDIIVYNAVSPGGDNPTLVIRYIDLIPETKNNRVTIFDRWQNKVWQGVNYDNTTVVFSGSGDRGAELPTGTYFYKIEFTGGRRSLTGFISLKR